MEYLEKVRLLNDLEILAGRRRLSSYPEFLVLLMSSRCNQHCVACGYHGPHSKAVKQPPVSYMPKSVLDSILKAAFHAGTIMLGGDGEPLLSPYFDDFVAQIGELQSAVPGERFVSTVTQGAALGRLSAGALKTLHRIHVSVDSPDPEMFALLRYGAQLDDVVANIRQVRSAAPNVRITLGVIVSQCNIYDLPALVDLAASLSVHEVTLNSLNIGERTASTLRPIQLRRCEMAAYRQILTKVCDRRDVHVTNHLELDNVTVDGEAMSRAELLVYLRQVYADWEMIPKSEALPLRLSTTVMREYSRMLQAYRDSYREDPRPHLVTPETVDQQIESLAAQVGGQPSELPYCTAPWRMAVVQENGLLRPCCPMITRDQQGPLGDAEIGAFEEDWNGVELAFLRELMHANRISELPSRCRQCQSPQRSIGKEQLLSTIRRYARSASP